MFATAVGFIGNHQLAVLAAVCIMAVVGWRSVPRLMKVFGDEDYPTNEWFKSLVIPVGCFGIATVLLVLLLMTLTA
jgi:hypothetical protein